MSKGAKTERAAMTKKIEIVDRGRGPQLSTSRITVQDVVPYLTDYSCDEIMELMPVLTVEGIAAIQEYVEENYAAVMEQDRRIREREAKRITSPEIEAIRKKGRAKMLALMGKIKKAKGS
jgi:uncharacterized protein (DUF433 family)